MEALENRWRHEHWRREVGSVPRILMPSVCSAAVEHDSACETAALDCPLGGFGLFEGNDSVSQASEVERLICVKCQECRHVVCCGAAAAVNVQPMYDGVPKVELGSLGAHVAHHDDVPSHPCAAKAAVEGGRADAIEHDIHPSWQLAMNARAVVHDHCVCTEERTKGSRVGSRT